jgi:hypothetical protein
MHDEPVLEITSCGIYRELGSLGSIVFFMKMMFSPQASINKLINNKYLSNGRQ